MPADADEARRAAEDILSSPEYREPAESWVSKVFEWIDDVLSRIFGTLGGSGGSSVVGWVILVVALIGVGVVAYFAVRSIRRSRRAAEDAPSDPEPRRRRRERPVDWSAEAAELEAAGRWRDGMRARYRALVADLSRDAVVDPAVSRTTGEHRREVGTTAPDAAPDFGDAAELFDRAWYGNRPTGEAESERFQELARRVEERTR